MKKSAWCIDPTLIDLLARRGSSWSEWLSDAKPRNWDDVEVHCGIMGVLPPDRKTYEKDVKGQSPKKEGRTVSIQPLVVKVEELPIQESSVEEKKVEEVSWKRSKKKNSLDDSSDTEKKD